MIIIQNILVSDDILETKFVCHLKKCQGACCWKGDFGAPLEDEEIREINLNLDGISKFLPDLNNKTVRKKGFFKFYKEEEFKGTLLLKDESCIFMGRDREGIAYCGIEKAYEHGDSTIKKPISCHLYPIRINKNEALEFEALNYDQWDICADACTYGKALEVPLYKFLKDAIIRKYGKDFYDELDAFAKHKAIGKHNP